MLMSSHTRALTEGLNIGKKQQSGRDGTRKPKKKKLGFSDKSFSPSFDQYRRAWSRSLSIRWSRTCSVSPGTFPTAEYGKREAILCVSCDNDSSSSTDCIFLKKRNFLVLAVVKAAL